MLSVLLFTDSDYPFGIFKRFLLHKLILQSILYARSQINVFEWNNFSARTLLCFNELTTNEMSVTERLLKTTYAIITDQSTLLRSFKHLFIVEVSIPTLVEVKIDGFISACKLQGFLMISFISIY